MFVLGEDVEGAEQGGGVAGVEAEFVEDAPGFEGGEGPFDCAAHGGERGVGLFLGLGEWVAGLGFVGGEHHLLARPAAAVRALAGVADVFVPAVEAFVPGWGQAGFVQVCADAQGAGCGDVGGFAGYHR